MWKIFTRFPHLFRNAFCNKLLDFMTNVNVAQEEIIIQIIHLASLFRREETILALEKLFSALPWEIISFVPLLQT